MTDWCNECGTVTSGHGHFREDVMSETKSERCAWLTISRRGKRIPCGLRREAHGPHVRLYAHPFTLDEPQPREASDTKSELCAFPDCDLPRKAGTHSIEPEHNCADLICHPFQPQPREASETKSELCACEHSIYLHAVHGCEEQIACPCVRTGKRNTDGLWQLSESPQPREAKEHCHDRLCHEAVVAQNDEMAARCAELEAENARLRELAENHHMDAKLLGKDNARLKALNCSLREEFDETIDTLTDQRDNLRHELEEAREWIRKGVDNAVDG